MFNFRKSESFNKPVKLDETSSANGVYIRICCSAEPVSDADGSEKIKYSYLEAFVPTSEFEQFKLACSVQGKDVSAAQIEYDYKLDTPVEYPATGFTYKPKWAESVYAGLLEKGKLLPDIFPMNIYDSTNKEERAVEMTAEQLTVLALFLAAKQQEYFNEKKKAEAEEKLALVSNV